MTALVTGAGGFLGLYIVEQLVARGDRVRALIRRECPALEKLGVEIVTADVRDADAVSQACAGVDVVYHVAGVAGIWGPWEHYHSINTVGTRNVIDGCRIHKVPKLVYTSSPSVTFDGSAQEGVDESGPYSSRWLCHYPHSKALAESEVLAANEPNLATCALRPHLIWGPRDHHLVPRLIERARTSKLRRVGDGQNLIDMVYVENAAAAHLLAADALRPDSPVAGRAYYISQGAPVNCWGWIDELLALAGLPKISRSISLPMAWAIGTACETVFVRNSPSPRAANDSVPGGAIRTFALLRHFPCVPILATNLRFPRWKGCGDWPMLGACKRQADSRSALERDPNRPPLATAARNRYAERFYGIPGEIFFAPTVLMSFYFRPPRRIGLAGPRFPQPRLALADVALRANGISGMVR